MNTWYSQLSCQNSIQSSFLYFLQTLVCVREFLLVQRGELAETYGNWSSLCFLHRENVKWVKEMETKTFVRSYVACLILSFKLVFTRKRKKGKFYIVL